MKRCSIIPSKLFSRLVNVFFPAQIQTIYLHKLLYHMQSYNDLHIICRIYKETNKKSLRSYFHIVFFESKQIQILLKE
jgi:hypothetical protein